MSLLSDSRSSGSPRRGFTLVELLVVVAIIALLLSILLPSLAQAREQSKRVRCFANLHDIGAAAMAYAQSDPSEYLTPMHSKYTETNILRDAFIGIQQAFGGKSGRHDYAVGIHSDFALGYASTKSGFGPATRPLNKVIYKSQFADRKEDDLVAASQDERLDVAVFRCPSDTGWTPGDSVPASAGAGGLIPDAYANMGTGTPTYDLYGNSYTNVPFFIFTTAPPLANIMRSITAVLRPQTQVPSPSRTVLFFEATDRGSWQWNHHDPAVNPGTLDSYLQGNHGGFNNVATNFCDGHTEIAPRYVLTDVTGLDEAGDPIHSENFQARGSRLETTEMPSGSPTTMGRVLYNGPNWTMHCFPSPEVRTSLTRDNPGGPRQ